MAKNITGDAAREDARDLGRQRDATTVLLTEDDDAFRETERLWLARERHYDTREAADGEEALAALDAAVDVLVLDLHMPKVSGPEVLARLDETTFDGDVVVVSASRLEDHEDGGPLGGGAVAAKLDKPVDCEEFVGTLDRYAR
ncbi:response regulator [Halorubellus sp. JP-L1]|uniref:response regulator n=1 Tax=Halorubellus sp. JP-L1 TaxID=2715753 RepID=UPI0014090431|nr:response regulator [Halorubellus sp. JP-L1]NHN42407.1 response regulator [Halorubellus sp. JP-L1]